MKKKIALIVGILAFAAVIAGAAILYNNLKDKVENEQMQTNDTNNADNTDSEANPAPDFTVTDAEGNEVKLSDFFGKPIILNFWASWCGPCQLEMPDFEESYNTYKDEIHFLMINLTDGSQETVESATSFIKEKGYTFPVYYDTKIEGAITYGISSVPQTFFIDAQGNVAAWANGMVDATTLQKGIDMMK